MNQKDFNYLDVNLKDVNPEYATLIRNLVDEKVNTRKAARNKLVEIGEAVLPTMYSLFSSKNELLRWEASKVIQEIASQESIPFMIALLEAEESEIRWIAAEGLIHVGRKTIKPLLHELKKEHEVNYYFYSGAHHVLNKLFDKDEKEQYKQLLNALNGKNGLQETVPFLSEKAVKEVPIT